ncbi:short subunit dehydrogenase [Streptomyces sp. CG 926]|nr:short subunit dehydrogenase [Streptomyces sp. CG 926]
MAPEHRRVVITAAGRDFGRTLALRFASGGAEVHLSARTLEAAERVREEILAQGHDADRVHAHACDLTDPASVRQFAGEVAARTEHIDVLVNNGARYQHGADLKSASDEDVIDTLASGATGTVLATKAFLPLLLKSAEPDIVTMISGCGETGHHRSDAHAAFYAAKSAQAGFTEILSRRLRDQGVRSSPSTRRTSTTTTRSRNPGRGRRARRRTRSRRSRWWTASSSRSVSPATVSSSPSTSSRSDGHGRWPPTRSWTRPSLPGHGPPANGHRLPTGRSGSPDVGPAPLNRP